MKTANIICGIKGVGKSNYSIKKWPNYLLIECNIPILSNSYSIIEQTVYKENGKHYISSEKLILDFYEILRTKDGIIIDNAELLDNNTLKLIVNISKQKNQNLIFVFDIPYKKLHTSAVFISLLEWDMIKIDDKIKDFKVDFKQISEFFFENFPRIQPNEIEKIIKITGYNFNEIKKLMWINQTSSIDNSYLTEKAINIYLTDWLGKKLTNISPKLTDVLKKSSIIGQTFEKHPLEHQYGFNILGVSNHLQELEDQEIFISKYMAKKDSFKFISEDVYNAIVLSISSLQKNEWHNILKEYYIKIFSFSNNDYIKLESLIRAKRSATEIKDFRTIFEINRVLLFKYINNNDCLKAITIINEMISDTYVNKDKPYIDYLLSLQIKILIDFGEYRGALDIVKKHIQDSYYTGSQDYLKYYHIKCLFCCGNIDTAYDEINKLIKKLKVTSKAGNTNQKIYPLIYSMMASIQNHLGVEDGGNRYYILALNYAKNLICDKILYYDILSKYDMFFSGEVACVELLKCVNFFKRINHKLKLGKTYVNLATEMMFEGCGTDCDIEQYLVEAKSQFIIPDENLAYVKNNLAIFYILRKNDFISAIKELESALFVNLSEFTYMTIYLNLTMCYFIVDGPSSKNFKDAYQQFIKFEELLENRKNATKYESVYRDILDLIVLDKSKNDIIYTCNKYLSSVQYTDFFYPIFQDIKNRACGIYNNNAYQNNCNFYKNINEKGIFIAEFRFWD